MGARTLSIFPWPWSDQSNQFQPAGACIQYRRMPDPLDENSSTSEAAHPQWFRPPTRREHWIAFGLFLGFGLFFLALFILHRNWWFRWIMFVLGLWSIYGAVRHITDARRST